MKTILALALVATLTGCMSAGKIAKELGKDNATVSVRVTSIYGSVSVFRSNPSNNAVTIAPDGTMTITPKP